jgi:hypothetical protein
MSSPVSNVVANVYLIGAQKSGTTFLAALLGQSPQVCVTSPKETHFFTLDYDKGLAFYADCFERPDAPIRIDASTTYTFLRPRRDMDKPDAPGLLAPVPERIHAVAPDARFIYVLRDPVHRAMSAYKHTQRKAPPPRGPVSLPQVLDADPMLVLAGRYADQIERYLEVFPVDRFLFLDFAELTRDPQAVLARCCDFVGIPSEGLAAQTTQRNQHSALRLTAPGRWLKQSQTARRIVRGVLPNRKLRGEIVYRLLSRPSEIEFTDVAAAEDLFAEDRARVAALTGIEI